MQEIFDLKSIIMQGEKRKDFRLYHAISEILAEDLEESFLIYKKKLQKALNLNGKDGFLPDLLKKQGIETREVNIFEADFQEISDKFDLILAPLFLHKTNNIKGVLMDIKTLLLSGGMFVGTFFGLSNLQDLGILLSNEDISICGQPLQRMLPLVDIKTIGNMLSEAGFKSPVVYSFPVSFEFENLKQGLYFLKNSGEGNVLKIREKSFLSGNVLKKYLEKYKNSITLEFEICFFSCHL
jgi:NADH dehydrogenase [ubiquinone] 1 alpha subcomplex assembly factor 5